MFARSWEQCYRDPMHTIYVDDRVHARTESGYFEVRYLVMRGHYSLNAYVGVPEDAVCASWPYDLVPLDVHGGLTFGEAGDGSPWPAGWWWYGWDYAHGGDRTWMDFELRSVGLPPYPRSLSERTWTLDLVVPDARRAAEQMLALAVMSWQPKQSEINDYRSQQARYEEWAKAQDLPLRQQSGKLDEIND